MDEKITINTQGGPVITGGTFSNIEFVANKYVYAPGGECKTPAPITVVAEDVQEEQSASKGSSGEHTPLPPELSGELAIALLTRCAHEKWLTENFQPQGLTNGKKCVLAEILSARLNIKEKWRVFGSFWNVKPEKLRQELYEKSGATKAFEKKVKKVFPEKR